MVERLKLLPPTARQCAQPLHTLDLVHVRHLAQGNVFSRHIPTQAAVRLRTPSPQGLLRTREVVERLKSLPPTAGQKPAILVYLGVLLQKGKLNALESAELAR